MTTSQKLWLGFGTLTTLLVLACVAALIGVRSIEEYVHQQANVARPRSSATRTLEMNVLGYALAVQAFAETTEEKFRHEAAEKADSVEQQLAGYNRLATTERQRQLAARFAFLWQTYQEFGQAILNSQGPLSRADSARLTELRIGLQRFLNQEMQPDALELFDARREATFEHLRNIASFVLILLIAGGVIAAVTGVAVGRAVVSSERVIAGQADRLRTTLASIGDAVITTDTQGRITDLNGVAESLTGWANAAAKGQPLDTVFRILNERTRDRVENPATRALREGVVVGLANHTILIAKDGTERAIDDSAAPIRYKEGQIAGCVLVFRDVSQQRQAARHLAESEARKTAMLDTALDCIVTCDHDGKIIEFNPAAERTFGYRRDDVIQRELGEIIIPPSLRERHRRGMARFMKTGQSRILGQRVVMTGQRADGSEFPVEFAVTEISTDTLPLFTAYLRDITDRQQAERAAAERLRHATLEAELGIALTGNDTLQGLLQACAGSLVRNLDGAFAGIWTLNETLRVLELRASAGMPTHVDGPQRHVPVGTFTIGLIAQEIKPYLTNAVVGDPRVPEQEWAKREGLVAFAGYPLVVDDRVLGVMAMFARQPLGEAAFSAMASAARGIALGIERNRMENELRQLVAELSEAGRRKDEFLAILAHELRNPLSPIRNGLQLLKLASGQEETVEQARSMMERQLTQLIRLVDDLMDLSRVTSGRIELRTGPVLLAAVVDTALEASRPLIEERGHQLTVTLPTQPITVDADLTRLAQVFMNLLNNAAKYSNPGARIWLTVERHGNDVVVSVKDTGIGIPAEQLPGIYEMFAQVDRSRESSQSGLGIGLTLVKRLVEMHGGTIEAKSEGLGKGSEFVVRLPVAVEGSGPQAPAAVE